MGFLFRLILHTDGECSHPNGGIFVCGCHLAERDDYFELHPAGTTTLEVFMAKLANKRKHPKWMRKGGRLTKKEIKAFLAGPIVARIATVKPDGSPYVVPVWQHYDGKAI